MAFPLRGPVLVVANHSGYLDPMWLAKVLPRSLTPMMTAYYFDKWWMRWMMVYLFEVIRVEVPKFRREPPDLKPAIAALDAGSAVINLSGRPPTAHRGPASVDGLFKPGSTAAYPAERPRPPRCVILLLD